MEAATVTQITNKGTGCQGPTKTGQPCRATLLQGRPYCFFHDPLQAEKRHASQGKGGKSNRLALPPSAVPGAIQTAADLKALLDRTLRGVASGEVAAPVGNTISVLAKAFIIAHESSEIEARLAALERKKVQK